MSLYHEAAEMLTAPHEAGGSLKSRIYSHKKLKSPPAQLYALVIEASKWSVILKEVIEHAELLKVERKLTPILAVLLVHDLLLSKHGIALPATHGLRATIERHKARLSAELTKCRVRRRLASLDDLRAHVAAASATHPPHPRWVRINTLQTQLEDQLDGVFAGFERVATIAQVLRPGPPRLLIDAHVPHLVAVSPSADLTKSAAYKSGAIILQDKASCFPAYLLDPLPEDGDVMDACAAPGNKTTHLAAILRSHSNDELGADDAMAPTIYACEKNAARARTLAAMLQRAGAQRWTHVHAGRDFLTVDPDAAAYQHVGALLLDPSCSGSGIVGRDDMPELHLPRGPGQTQPPPHPPKRKRAPAPPETLVDDDGHVEVLADDAALTTRLAALAAFQLELLLHAFQFPAAHKITYSTCSIHAAENEQVVTAALASDIARARGWRILARPAQVRGMAAWPMRGYRAECASDEVAEACIRAQQGDEHGTMGFFLAGFVRDRPPVPGSGGDDLWRDADGRIVRDAMGVPVRATATAGDDDDEEWMGFDDDA